MERLRLRYDWYVMQIRQWELYVALTISDDIKAFMKIKITSIW